MWIAWSVYVSLAYSAGRGKSGNAVPRLIRDSFRLWEHDAKLDRWQRAALKVPTVHCSYCGRPVKRQAWPAVCPYHSDLPGCESL